MVFQMERNYFKDTLVVLWKNPGSDDAVVHVMHKDDKTSIAHMKMVVMKEFNLNMNSFDIFEYNATFKEYYDSETEPCVGVIADYTTDMLCTHPNIYKKKAMLIIIERKCVKNIEIDDFDELSREIHQIISL